MKIKNISKKALAVVMSLAVLASALMLNTFSAFADGEDGQTTPTSPTPWTGTVAEAFAGGKGTAADPYQIATAEQFALFGKYMVDKTVDTANPVNNLPYYRKAFILTADILLNDVKSEAWAALTAGTATADQLATLKQWTYGKTGKGGEFGGVLDGNYHTLKGMYIDAVNDNAGLIPRVSYGSTVKNLGIESSFIRTTLTGAYEKAAAATAIFAQTNNWQDGNHLVENCYLADTVTIKAVNQGGKDKAMAGSFYGDNAVNNATWKTTIRNCYTKAVVEGEVKGSFVASWWNTDKLGLQVINSYATQTGMNIVGRVGSDATSGPALKNNVLCTNTYSAGTNSIWVNGGDANDSDWGYKSFRDVTLLTLSQMNGKRVTETMPGLFGTDSLWVAVDGNTPQLKDFALANGTPDVWNGTVATGFAKGSGSSTDPYQIATAEEFAYFGKLLFTGSATTGKYFELTNDIYLNDINSSAWQKLMAGTATDAEKATLNEWNVKTGRAEGATPEFNGHFDGDYHVIKGFYTNSNYQFISPFGKMGWGFRGLKNLGIESSYISSTWDVFSDSGKNGTGYVAPFFSDTHNVLDGGIKSKSIENCYAADSVILKGQLVGCFIGQSQIDPYRVTTDVEIKNCYTSAQSTSTATVWGGARHASFIAGYYYAAGFKFTNCYSTCNLPIFTGVDGGNYNKYNTADNNYRASTSCTNCYALQDNAKYPGFKKLTSGYMYGLKAKKSMSDLFGKDSPWVALFGNTPKLKAFGYEVLTMWDGETTYAPMAVSDTNPGTEENPYLIYDAAELAYVADQIQNGNVKYYYELREDIYLNDITDPDWQKLVAGESVDKDKLAKFNQWNYGNCTGNDGRYGLSGRIDGNNHVIRGVYALVDGVKEVYIPHSDSYSTAKHTALFRGILGGGSIIDLGIESSYFSANVAEDAKVGAFVVYVQSSSTSNPDVIINGCYVDNTYICGKLKTGGLIGFSEVKAKDAEGNPTDRELIIENCYSNATLSGGSQGNIIGYAGFGDLITIKNCYGSHAAELIGSFWDKGDIETDGYVNCYTANTGSTIEGITRLTADQMKGADAVGYMDKLFEVDNNTDDIKDWYVMTGETPKLFSFSGRTEAIVMGDFNVDDAVNLLDLVRLAQARAKVEGVAINESNALVLEHEANYTAYLKNHLLTGTAFNEIVFPPAQ